MDVTMITVAPLARAHLIKLAQGLSRTNVVAQAGQTLSALSTHGTKLVDYGFGAADIASLKNAREVLVAAGSGRTQRRMGKKQALFARREAMRRARALRLRALSVLQSAGRLLILESDAAAHEAVGRINAALHMYSAVEEKAEPMAAQLSALNDVLAVEAIAKAVKSRGGPKLVKAIGVLVQELRDAEDACSFRRGTPEETEQLKVLDGMIVELVRSARSAASAAAKELGEPSLITAFRLDSLYRRTGKARAEPEPTPANEVLPQAS